MSGYEVKKMTKMDGRNDSWIKITAVKNHCVSSAAHLTRRFVDTVFSGVSLFEAVVTKFAL